MVCSWEGLSPGAAGMLTQLSSRHVSVTVATTSNSSHGLTNSVFNMNFL